MKTLKAILSALGFMALCRVLRLIFINMYALCLVALEMCGWLLSAEQTYRAQVDMLSLWSEVILVPLLLLFFWLQKKPPLAKVYYTRCAVKPLLLAVAVGIGACVAVTFLLTVIPFPVAWQTDYQEKSQEVIDRTTPVYTAVMTVLIAPLVEETVFRGLVYGRLREGMPTWLAAIITGVIFGIAHGSPIWFVYTFLLGLILCWLFESTGSLLPSIVCHAVFNILGQISLFPEGTPFTVVLVVYVAGIALLAAALWYFGKVTEPAAVLPQEQNPAIP